MHELTFLPPHNINLGRVAVVFLLCLCLVPAASAQKRVKLKHASTLKGGIKDGERVDRVIGDVVFVQNNTTIYCDSAIFYKTKNSVDAFGRIRITEGDSVNITAYGLTYDGNLKLAYLRKEVVFTKLGIATLYTDFLDYDRKKNEARYFNGGKLVDSTNTLTSKKGYYDIPTNMASFKTDVVGVNEENTLESDTLQYNSKTKIVYFRDVTHLKDKEGRTAVYQNGFYNTNQKLSTISNGEIESPAYKLRGDTYFIDDLRKFYRAKGNVVMTSKEENLIVYGDDGFYDKAKGISKVYTNAFVAKISDDQDTVFISADTLVSIDNPNPRKKRLLAYHHVKIFKTDLQGIADSLAYVEYDSTIYFYKDPVLWNEGNQMTADSIRILLKNKTVNKIYLIANSFVISEDSLKNYNQIKGKRMTASFAGNSISNVYVQGNGESLYYALQEQEARDEPEGQAGAKAKDEKATTAGAGTEVPPEAKEKPKQKVSVMMGMNKIICTNMKINFKEGKLDNISFYVKPDASFIPPHELTDEDKKLKGFTWRLTEKPARKDVVKRKP